MQACCGLPTSRFRRVARFVAVGAAIVVTGGFYGVKRKAR